jgi:hypothetical protein
VEANEGTLDLACANMTGSFTFIFSSTCLDPIDPAGEGCEKLTGGDG